MKILPGLVLPVLLFSVPATAGVADRAAESAARQVAAEPGGLEKLFDGSFFRQVSLSKLSGIFSGLYKEHGAVERTVLVSSSAYSGHYYFDTTGGWRVPLAVSADPETGKIIRLFFRHAYRRDVTLRGLRDTFAALPGRKGLLVRRLGETPENLEELAAADYFAVGSAFKLYVLAAMARLKTPWDKVFYLRDGDRSMPSGRLQDWPEDSPLTAHTLAALMISESDNTAADLLIDRLGRRKIEGALAALGHSDPSRLKPFLKTTEMVKLKSGTGTALKYLNLPAAEKYSFLDSLARQPLEIEKFTRSPFGLDKVEWFASPADLCGLMQYLEREGGATALELMALNTGGVQEGAFLYAGFKGGSEPGVISATWLLKNRKSEWYCLSASWNDEADTLDEKKFFDLMGAAINTLGPAD
ncbi:MAG: serine hydrolase [Elusimicrobiales bacterium]|nr:serine hydrolase [Elusimicrobiales bacterium]